MDMLYVNISSHHRYSQKLLPKAKILKIHKYKNQIFPHALNVENSGCLPGEDENQKINTLLFPPQPSHSAITGSYVPIFHNELV